MRDARPASNRRELDAVRQGFSTFAPVGRSRITGRIAPPKIELTFVLAGIDLDCALAGAELPSANCPCLSLDGGVEPCKWLAAPL